MSSFFAFEDSFPYGRGFALFGPGHLVWLLGILAAAGAAGRLYAGASPLARRRGDLALGVVLEQQRVIKHSPYLSGVDTPAGWPNHNQQLPPPAITTTTTTYRHIA